MAEALEMMGREDVNQMRSSSMEVWPESIARGHIVRVLQTRAELVVNFAGDFGNTNHLRSRCCSAKEAKRQQNIVCFLCFFVAQILLRAEALLTGTYGPSRWNIALLRLGLSCDPVV